MTRRPGGSRRLEDGVDGSVYLCKAQREPNCNVGSNMDVSCTPHERPLGSRVVSSPRKDAHTTVPQSPGGHENQQFERVCARHSLPLHCYTTRLTTMSWTQSERVYRPYAYDPTLSLFTRRLIAAEGDNRLRYLLG